METCAAPVIESNAMYMTCEWLRGMTAIISDLLGTVQQVKMFIQFFSLQKFQKSASERRWLEILLPRENFGNYSSILVWRHKKQSHFS